MDSGLVFERDANFFGRSFLQTLEPRAFYTYTPFSDQSRLPVYDTAANDFNSPPSTPRTPMAAMTASPTTTC